MAVLLCVLAVDAFLCGWLAASSLARRRSRVRHGGYLPPRAYTGTAYPSMPHHGTAAGIGSLEGGDRGNGLLPFEGHE